MFTHFLRKAAVTAGAAVLCLVSVAPAMAATSNDRVPSTVQSCTSDATTGRNTLPFDCSETATKWVIGTAPTLSCYAGASVPTCGANQDFLCNTGACVCRSGFTMCGATSTCVANVACSGGQTFDACAGACVGNIGVTLQSGTGTRQGASGTNATISVHGNLDIAGGGTAGDIYMSSGRDIFVNGAATTDLTVLNDTAGQLFNFNVGSTTRQGNLNAFGDVWVDDSDTLGKGIQLEAADRPLITRNWDAFTSGAYSGVGRWGLFMEPNYLTVGVPNTASRGFRVRSFNPDSTAVDRLTVDASTGAVGVTGALNVTGATTLSSTLRIPTGAAAGRLLTSDATGNATWQLPPSGGVGGSGTVNTLAMFGGTGTTMANSNVLQSGTGIVGIANPTPNSGFLEVGPADQLVVDNSGIRVAGYVQATGLMQTTGNFAVLGNTTIGNAATDTVSVMSGAWTFQAPATVALVPAANALNFDANTLSIDAFNNRVGIGTAAPTNVIDVGGTTDASTGISLNGSVAISGGYDSAWLRLNQASDFTSGVYTPGTLRSDGRLLLPTTSDADLATATSGALIIGGTGGANIVIDNNEMMARNNGAAATLTFQNQGGITAFGGSIEAERNTNTASYFGRAAVGYCGHSDYACFSHLDSNSTGGYALLQDSVGGTYVNAAAGRSILFRNNNLDIAKVDAGGLSTWGNFWVGGETDLSGNLSVYGGYIDAWGGNSLNFLADTVNDTSYEFLGYYSGGTRQGIMIWDGNWDGCASNSAFCIKAEAGNSLNLKAASGWVNSLSNFSVTGELYSTVQWNGPNGGASYPTHYSADLTSVWNPAAVVGAVWGESLNDLRGVAGGYFANDQRDTYEDNGTYGSIFGNSSAVYAYIAYKDGGGSGYSLYANRGTYTSGSYTGSSRRYKHDIDPIEGALSKVLKLRGVEFTWNGDTPIGEPNKRDMGVIAEEIYAQFPLLVVLDEEGKPKGVDYSKMSAALIEATKELNAKVEAQQKEIDALEARLLKLEAKLTK